jgi:hypothetical protein
MTSFLQDAWTCYFHDPDDSNWNNESYHRVCDVSTVEDFWEVNDGLAPFLSRGMFFLMREHVYPCWDDKLNITGGCLSMKVLKDELPAFWEYVATRMLGESLVLESAIERHHDPDRWSIVNGVSVSPKRFFSIVKLWLRDELNVDREDFDLPPSYSGEVLFRSNSENIKNNNLALSNHRSRKHVG